MLGKTEVMTGAGRGLAVGVGVVYLGVRRGWGVWGAEGTSFCAAASGGGGKLPPDAPQ